MDSGMFYGLQKGAIAALELDEQWFTELNTVYRKRSIGVQALVEKIRLYL